MIDPFGRHISYLRVSVTDRCDFRCVYCMAEDMTFLPKADLLSLEELDRLASALVGMGVRKIRLTGGEPLVRRNVMWLIGQLGRHLRAGTLDELTLTTNGSQLARFAPALAAADVGIAMGGGTDLARNQADIVLLSGRLGSLAEGVTLSRRALAIIRQNLWWSFAYNFTAVPLAMSGLVTPWMAGIGMSASSLLVVLNALRLQRKRPR